jgi:hypothetical protein
MTKVIGTLLVPFGESASGVGGAIVAEWDDTMNVAFAGKVLNSYISAGKRYYVVRDGNTVRVMTATDIKSQFIPGETAYLLVHAAPQLRIVAVKATYGTIGVMGLEVLSRSDELGFPLQDEPLELQYLPAGQPAFAWFGNIGREIVVAGRQVKAGGGVFPCLARITYPVQFTRYALQTPALTLGKDQTVPILVYVYYEEAGP